MKRWTLNILVLFIFIFGCGSADDFDSTVPTQTTPFINRTDPASAAAGDTVTIYGYGFSTEPANNAIIIAGTATVAATYSLVDPPVAGEIEMLTFTVPAGISAGSNSILVYVFDNPSNADVSVDITL